MNKQTNPNRTAILIGGANGPRLPLTQIKPDCPQDIYFDHSPFKK